jgi:hypothetical protein
MTWKEVGEKREEIIKISSLIFRVLWKRM